MKPSQRFQFLLYVADNTENSALAVANLKMLCQAHLANRCDIEIVDVFKEPQRALVDSVYMTPLLIRRAPGPVRRIVGTLSQTDKVIVALGLETQAA